MHDITEIRDSVSGALCTFRRVGAMLIAADIADDVERLAPSARRVKSWENSAFGGVSYAAIRSAGYYTESIYQGRRQYRLLILPAVTDENRLALQAMRRAAFQL